MELLEQITALSHEFGTTDYVRGGGGNSSVKNADTLWVKPSGTTLGTLAPDRFVALDRQRLAALYDVESPTDPTAREALVKKMMAAAVLPETPGRASVEAPLHSSFEARYVVHTHPAAVNGLTCSQDGPERCRKLFPDALWIDYVDPGYTLCLRVRQALADYASAHGRQPELVFLQNHGIFVGGDQPEEIRAAYDLVMTRLAAVYAEVGITGDVQIGPPPGAAATAAVGAACRQYLGEADAGHIVASGPFPISEGPLTPDHIVYHKPYPFVGDPTEETLTEFRAAYGFSPRLVIKDCGVFGVGSSSSAAALAVEMAIDGSRIMQLARAFGGVRYLQQRDWQFIENWEVEAYRRQQLQT